MLAQLIEDYQNKKELLENFNNEYEVLLNRNTQLLNQNTELRELFGLSQPRSIMNRIVIESTNYGETAPIKLINKYRKLKRNLSSINEELGNIQHQNDILNYENRIMKYAKKKNISPKKVVRNLNRLDNSRMLPMVEPQFDFDEYEIDKLEHLYKPDKYFTKI